MMFNQRLNNVKYLIATDAVGMGLNLNIQRVIFFALEKRTKTGRVKLNQSEVK